MSLRAAIPSLSALSSSSLIREPAYIMIETLGVKVDMKRKRLNDIALFLRIFLGIDFYRQEKQIVLRRRGVLRDKMIPNPHRSRRTVVKHTAEIYGKERR